MRLFNLREALQRLIFWGQNLRYLSKKHYLLTVFLLLAVIVIVFTCIYINQRRDIARKENIVRSFYEEGDKETTFDNNTAPGGLEADTVIVHICGEVVDPGVFEVEKGSRVIDCIKIAGGETGSACTEPLNLAQEVFDGQKIHIPSLEEVDSGKFGSDNTGNTGIDSNDVKGILININTAPAGQLESLPGIGPVTALNIIEYREKYGGFNNKEDLMDVSGIGYKKFELIKDHIDV